MEIFKVGEVSDIDVEKGKVRVIFPQEDDLVSDWINILVPFSESHQDSYMLSKGQTVYCLFIPGMIEQGVVLGSPMRKGPSNENEIKRTFSDGGFWSYKDGILTLEPIEKIKINAKKIEINADVEISKNVKIKSDLTVDGSTITGGSINLNTHTHPGIYPGPGITGGPQ
ncbi:phage baseplate assembly protein V [Streptobacillus moniliformis]|uniref:phage baseplate assembly protein V n=1 Tax=Streptobacillus moniliformis TaxID=34105 RepID=UPI0007E3814E|nr:phage baseplate assembly protein V [Streptobacillus moniliformis]QXW65664.1 phage baseplate assembly protein V [Streptobacillus moniliformis]